MDTLKLATELRAVTTRLVKKMRGKTPVGDTLSLTERSTIFLLYQKEMYPSDLAAMEKVTTQSMSQILNHLSELGLISRTISKTDKRKSIISLSKKGKAMVETVSSQKDEWLHQALEQVCTEKELDALQKIIIPLTRIVEFD